MMPGTTYLPDRSTIVAPAGAFTSRPIAVIRPLCITTVAPLCGAAPDPSMSVALVRAVTWACALLIKLSFNRSSAAATIANARMVAPKCEVARSRPHPHVEDEDGRDRWTRPVAPSTGRDV